MSTNEVVQDVECIKGRCTVLYKEEITDEYADSLPPDTYVYRYCYDPGMFVHCDILLLIHLLITETHDFLDPPFVGKHPRPKV